MASSRPGTPVLAGGRRHCALPSPSDGLKQTAPATKRQDAHLSPTWAALSRLPGIGSIRTKSPQEPLPAASRLINLPLRTLGGSSHLPGPQRPPFSLVSLGLIHSEDALQRPGVCAHAGRGQRRGSQTCPLCCRPQPPGAHIRSALVGGVNGWTRRLPECLWSLRGTLMTLGALGPWRYRAFSPP